jgi:hypothetical protein
MYTGQYRIVQTGDDSFRVEEMRLVPIDSWKPWVKRQWVEEWHWATFSGHHMAPAVPPFKTIEQAQKWVDDKRKYPIVVKQPA